jgi:hypothetical protein
MTISVDALSQPRRNRPLPPCGCLGRQGAVPMGKPSVFAVRS